MLSLTEALAALPDTADAIAARLGAHGCRGARENAEYCPVANWLRTLGFTGQYVAPDYIVVDQEARSVPTPGPVADFAERFDSGEWPELVLDDTADDADPTDKEPNP